MFSLPRDLNNECAEQSLSPCYWWTAFSGPSSKWNYHSDHTDLISFVSQETWRMMISVYWSVCHIFMCVCMYIYSLGQDDQNVVQHDSFGQVTSFALASATHDAHGIVKGTTEFLKWRWLKWSIWLFWSCDDIGTGITWCWQYHE